MQSANISLIINSICKELDIPYESKNLHSQSFRDDAIKLGCIYRDLKIMIGEIHDIETRHGIDGIKEKLEEIITELDNLDHQIIKLAKELRNKDEK